MTAEAPPPRRRFPRIASHHSVLVKKVGIEEVEEFAHTKTIAIGGCSFIAPEPLGENSVCDLLIAVDGRVINARGRVVYDNGIEDGRREIGVQFVDLDENDANRIAQLFEKPTHSVGPADL
jgi:hypothetical protein